MRSLKRTNKTLMTINITDAALRQAAKEGVDAFLSLFVRTIREAIGGELTAETMPLLNSDQITLLAWDTIHEEVMDGGFIQLIHNGYGGFVFLNPTAKAFRLWGLHDLCKLLYAVRPLYTEHHDELERDCSDEDFMALYEQFPKFDDMDDVFVEHEEEWTERIAHYVDDNIDHFASIKP